MRLREDARGESLVAGMASPDAGSVRAGVARRKPWQAVLVTIRPKQWVKNALVVAAAGAAGALGHDDVPLRVGLACVAFCLLASGIYAINDVRGDLHLLGCGRSTCPTSMTSRGVRSRSSRSRFAAALRLAGQVRRGRGTGGDAADRAVAPGRRIVWLVLFALSVHAGA